MFIVIILLISTVLCLVWTRYDRQNIEPAIAFVICFVLLIVSIGWNAMNNTHQKPKEPGYELYLYDDSIVVKDDDRLVGKFGYNSDIGKLMLKDNE